MKIDTECVGCIINQSVKVANAINASKSLSEELKSTVEDMSKGFSYLDTPPQIAADVYEKMSVIANKSDLYDEVKKLSTQKALSFVPNLEKKLQTSEDIFLTSIKIAVAGNVIDLAAAVEFDLENELEHIFDTNFAHDDVEKLKDILTTSKKVVVLGDNVGEHIFDYMFIKVLRELYPEIKFYYFVRGTPIINDVTLKEANEIGFDKVCEVVDSGVNTPGFDYIRATKYAKELFDSADVVISKGMGNYESLSPSHRKKICFLLKVKCLVVASSLNKELGDIICKVV